jgi:hypothetical protein
MTSSSSNFLAPGAKEQWNDDILWPSQVDGFPSQVANPRLSSLLEHL